MSYEVAIVGTGENPEEKGREGYAMAYRHADAYQSIEGCSVVCCADIVRENAEAFADHFGVEGVYEDYEEMLREERPDIVSVCVPPAVHAEIVVGCADAPSVSAIHCEKPMATTWGDCKRMVTACEEAGVQLTIDHQRRFAEPARQAKALLDDDRIGDLRRIEWSEVNLFDAGTHLFDLCDYFVDGTPAEWVLSGIECEWENRWFGVLNETRGLAQWRYEDGTMGFASTADDDETLVDAYLRLVGTDGTIEIQSDDGPPLRIRTDGDWEVVDTEGESIYRPSIGLFWQGINKVTESIPGVERPIKTVDSHYQRAIEHAVSSLRSGTEPIISGRRALRGTELVFASWESSRRRNRVDLPLDIEDNPFESMYEDGVFGAKPLETERTTEAQQSSE